MSRRRGCSGVTRPGCFTAQHRKDLATEKLEHVQHLGQWNTGMVEQEQLPLAIAELRQRLNRWIREESGFDAVLDIDALVRDPQHPGRLLGSYDSGDHLIRVQKEARP